VFDPVDFVVQLARIMYESYYLRKTLAVGSFLVSLMVTLYPQNYGSSLMFCYYLFCSLITLIIRPILFLSRYTYLDAGEAALFQIMEFCLFPNDYRIFAFTILFTMTTMADALIKNKQHLNLYKLG
jgi:hypothetical protein